MDHVSQYEPVSIIEYRGRVNAAGQSGGHYICDLKDKKSGMWYRTNDNKDPVQINESKISKSGYVILYRKLID